MEDKKIEEEKLIKRYGDIARKVIKINEEEQEKTENKKEKEGDER